MRRIGLRHILPIVQLALAAVLVVSGYEMIVLIINAPVFLFILSIFLDGHDPIATFVVRAVSVLGVALLWHVVGYWFDGELRLISRTKLSRARYVVMWITLGIYVLLLLVWFRPLSHTPGVAIALLLWLLFGVLVLGSEIRRRRHMVPSN